MKEKQEYENALPLVAFISHMVQMKEVCAKRLKINDRTLYPTWFRWKSTGTITYSEVANFISHMVQMKVKRGYP